MIPRAVAKELVAQRAEGMVVLPVPKLTAVLATVSPSCVLLETPRTPALIVKEATGFTPPKTKVPMPFLLKAKPPVMMLLASCVRVSPAPISKALAALSW
jgi:hypothetical protein